MRAAGRNPGFRLGMAVKDLGSAAAWGGGRDFVFEGDEYTSAVFDPRPKFLHFAPQLAVLTNIDWDHPDVFPDPAAYEAVFRELLEYLGPEDRLIACSDDPTVRRLLSRTRASVHPGRLLACFVPHPYTRPLSLMDGYADAFQGCALVVIGPIEPARERHLAHPVTSQDLASRLRGVAEVFTADSARSAAYRLASAARPGDVIIFISVRDFDGVIDKTAEVLERSPVA